MPVYLPFLISAAIVVADQMIKNWVRTVLAEQGSIWVINGILKFTYVENRGAAFGILHGQRYLIASVVIAVVLGASYMILSKKITHPILMLALGALIGGGIGNLIDRISLGYVIDYIDINPLFTYPMFNLADCCVVTGTVVIAIYLLFFENSENSKPKGSDHTGAEE